MIKSRLSDGAAVDSIALTFVRVVTALISIVIAKLLAVNFSVEEYGVYSQALLVSTTVTSFTILGMSDACNYFYNKTLEEDDRNRFLSTIFVIQMCIGCFFALLIIVFPNYIAHYFGNDKVKTLLPYVAFMPLLTNLMHMLQVLFVSAGKAKTIAVRNLVLALVKISYMSVICLLVKNITLIVICLLVVDVITTLYMWLFVNRCVIKIHLKNMTPNYIKPILAYSIPMAGYILTNSLSRNMDKLVIGRLSDTATLAVYSIASKELPFDMLTLSLVTVLVPFITRAVATGDDRKACGIFSKYMQISYAITWPLAVGAVVASYDLMLILYDEKYIVGLPIMIVYIFVDMIRFANVSIIFSAKARTRELLVYSCSALVANLILNIVFYNFLGTIGPAIATVIVTIILNFLLLRHSTKLINGNLINLFNAKRALTLIGEIFVFAGIAYSVRYHLIDQFPLLVRFGVTYIIYLAPILLLNYRDMLNDFREINKLKVSK